MFLLANAFFCTVGYNSLKQGCGTRPKISSSSSRYLKFLARFPAPKWFGTLKTIVLISYVQPAGRMRPSRRFCAAQCSL